MSNYEIKRGVSLYSYQEEYFLGTKSLEDLIKVSADMGAKGIELISEQTFPHYPNPLDQSVYDNWHALMAKYGTTPVCHDFMLDYKKYKDRPMPFDEQVASCKVDIDHAARLGCPYTRALVSIDPDVLEDIAVTIDGKAVPREQVRFSVRGRTWTLDEMETEYSDRWNFGEKALITVLRAGGLPPGKHKLQLAERIRVSYLPFVPTTRDSKELEIAA